MPASTNPEAISWPRPYLLQIYERAIAEGCIAIPLEHDEHKFRSLKAAFHRIRRRADAQNLTMIKPSYYMCAMSWDAVKGRAIVTYSALPDGATLPAIESIATQTPMVMPSDAPAVSATPELEPNFDAEDHVKGLLKNIDLGLEEGGTSDEL